MTNSDPKDDEERPPADGPDRDSSRDEFTGIRLDIGLTSVTDLVNSLLDADVSRPTQDHPRRRPDGPGKVGRKRDEPPPSPGDAGGASDEEGTPSETVQTDTYHVRTYEGDGELTVVADLPGVNEEDLSVGLTKGDDLLVAVDGTPVDRITLPWDPMVITKVWFNNGVLEVVVRPIDGGSGKEED